MEKEEQIKRERNREMETREKRKIEKCSMTGNGKESYDERITKKILKDRKRKSEKDILRKDCERKKKILRKCKNRKSEEKERER